MDTLENKNSPMNEINEKLFLGAGQGGLPELLLFELNLQSIKLMFQITSSSEF